MLKTAGYLVSSVSVALLGLVSWKSASEQPLLLAALIGGMAASIIGMLLRWLSFRQEQKSGRAVAEVALQAAASASRAGSKSRAKLPA